MDDIAKISFLRVLCVSSGFHKIAEKEAQIGFAGLPAGEGLLNLLFDPCRSVVRQECCSVPVVLRFEKGRD